VYGRVRTSRHSSRAANAAFLWTLSTEGDFCPALAEFLLSNLGRTSAPAVQLLCVLVMDGVRADT
jgi:hypothetical protein